MEKNFGGVIWTNHALQRLRERGIKQGDAWATWRRPDQSKKGTALGSWVYYRTFPSTGSGQMAQKIEVVAKQNERKEWIILSVWSRPTAPFGARSATLPGQKSSFWKNLFKTFLLK